MISAKKLTGLALATAAAAMFAAAPVAIAGEKGTSQIHCEGANSCKGKSACQTASNACKGQNSCKGKGWTEMTAEECETAKIEMKKDM